MSSCKIIKLFILAITFFCINQATAQVSKDTSLFQKPIKDTIVNSKGDTSIIKKHSPRIATFRSAVLPGWGQYYNKKYWKIPVVYGLLGGAATVFFYNLKTYKKLRSAYIIKTDTLPGNDGDIDPRFKNLSPESIRSYRNSFRQNMDYSILFFLLFWGLNVVDATVDAHLKEFDVSDDLSLRILPGKSNMANTTGLSFVLKFKDKRANLLSSSLK